MQRAKTPTRLAAVLTVAVPALACHSTLRPPSAPAMAAPSPSRSVSPGVCEEARDNGTRRLDPHEDLDSILWQQTAAEYRATTTTVYRAAAAALGVLVASNRSGKDPVVIFDLDETVLDNSRLQGHLLAAARNYDSRIWDCWVSRKEALLVPGADLLFRALVEHRVRGRFITNRKCRPRGDGNACPQETETLENLNALVRDTGYVAAADELLLSAERDPSTNAAWDDEKKPRRDFVARTHQAVLLVGDDLADFLEGVRKSTIAGRAVEFARFSDRWGKDWFLLPNPSYGSWLTAVDQEATATPPRRRHEVVESFSDPKP